MTTKRGKLADTVQTGRIYSLIQSAVLGVYAAAVFFGPATPRLLAGEIPRAIGGVFCVAGPVLLAAGISRLGRAIQIYPEPKADATLVTTGIYRWFRHPIYTSIVIVVAGLFLRRPTLAVAIGAAIVIAFLEIKVRFEEKLLVARYPEYAGYKRRSWGLLPWPLWWSQRS